MIVYLIKASAPGPFKAYKKAMGAPPQNIFSIAAATPEDVGIEMCDETIGMKPKLDTQADIVAIFFHTPDAIHAYRLADKFRAKGKTVVLGGLHPSFLPDEASVHADALLIGEAEEIWEALIHDFKNHTLKQYYKREKPVDLADVRPYPTDILPPSKYDHIWTVLVSRGCVHKCDYCTVPPFFNGKYRLRPIENIVAEIKAAPTDWFELHADNLTADRAYALKLFEALKPLKISWSGEATIKMADDEELLQAAAESGCKWLLIGIETPSQAALRDSGKGFVEPDTIKDKIRRFHSYGIHITSSMIFGFDTHNQDIFEESEQFCRHIDIDELEAVLLIPFPGTPLFERLAAEGRLLIRDWSKYDGSHVVFQPANMSPEELEQGADWFWNEIRKNKALNSAPPGKAEAESDSGSVKRGKSMNGPALSTGGTTIRWKSILALVIIGVGLYFNWYWIWGALLVIWGISDLRSRYTCLLDEIPRSESPILYWIVVLMWLTMGIWTLSNSPVIGDLSDGVNEYFSASEHQDIIAGQGKVKRQQKNMQLVRNELLRFTFQGPVGWQIGKQKDSDSVTFHLQNAKHTATITAIAFDYRTPFSLSKHLGYLEEELQTDLPFVRRVQATTPMSPLMINDEGAQMVFKDYSGKFEGEKVTARVGYAVRKSYGYSIIGVFGDGDRRMRDVINRSLTSFRLTEP